MSCSIDYETNSLELADRFCFPEINTWLMRTFLVSSYFSGPYLSTAVFHPSHITAAKNVKIRNNFQNAHPLACFLYMLDAIQFTFTHFGPHCTYPIY